jgi:hypothetical protein
MEKLLGTEGSTDLNSWVRSCRGNSSKDTVDCVNAAKSVGELEKCGLTVKKGSGSN